jgi:hypothetical protein
LIYEELRPIGELEFESVLANGSSDEKRGAVFRGADCAEDYSWLIDRFKCLLETVTDPKVLSAVVLGVGYIARRFRQADERELKKMLRPFANVVNPMEEVAQAEWDIYVYLSRERRKRKRERRRALLGKV